MRLTTVALAAALGLTTLMLAPGAASADRITIHTYSGHETATIHGPYHRTHTYTSSYGHVYHRPAHTYVEYHSRPVFTNYYTGSRQFHAWPTVTHEVYEYAPGTTRTVSHEVYRSYR